MRTKEKKKKKKQIPFSATGDILNMLSNFSTSLAKIKSQCVELQSGLTYIAVQQIHVCHFLQFSYSSAQCGFLYTIGNNYTASRHVNLKSLVLHELLRLVLSVCPVFITFSCKGQYINQYYLSICYLSTLFKMRLFYFFID